MIDNNLIGYIEQNLNKGYSDSSIQNTLINQGYPATNVLDTINYVKKNNRNTRKTPVQSQGASKKGLYIIISIVLVIIIGLSIFFFMSLSPKSISEKEVSQGTNFDLTENKEVINPNDIILDIILPKKSFTIGEEISGEYYLNYQGVPFKGVIMCTTPSNEFYRVKTTLENLDSKVSGKIGSGIGSFPTYFSYTSSKENTYIYSISVYSCDDINNNLNRNDCGDSIDLSDMIDTMKQVTPLKSNSKSIVVEGGKEQAPECHRDDDCTQTCTNCEDGTYVCAGMKTSNLSIYRTCVECFISADCKWKYGYECNSDYMCVLEEEETYEVTDPQTILDCYSEDLSEILCSPEKALEFTTTFETRLVSCEISEGTFGLGFEPMIGMFRGYKIQAEQDDNCTIKFWFLDSGVVKSNLLNKYMVCEYDSSRRASQDVNDCFPECCSGDLVDAINAIQS